MTTEILSKNIGLPADAYEAAMAVKLTAEEIASYRTAILDDPKKFRPMAEAHADPNLLVLALALHWGADAYDTYHNAGVSDEIYFGTFRDIALWSGRYRERTGRIGLIEWHWFIVHIQMKLFRLGRLQFEPIGMKEDITLPDGTFIPAGTPALSVHIPRGDSLKPEDVRESFERSKTFFKELFGTEYRYYYCCSWLLAPALGGMLSEGSSIAEFRKHFTVYDEDLSYAQAEDYVFLQKLDDPADYAENTSLQRNLKKYLMNGGKMGMGKGVIVL